MSTSTEDVDWAAVERPRARDTVLAPLGMAAFFASLTALQDGYAGLRGRAGWIAIAALFALFISLLLAQRLVPEWRARTARARRVQYALRHHVDPGEALRDQADVGARRLARLRWVLWCSPLVVAGMLAGGRWDRPAVAVPAAVVLVGFVLGSMVALNRQLQSARRWIADPPGPPRDAPAPTAVERWTGGRRLVLLICAGGVVVAVVGVAIAQLG